MLFNSAIKMIVPSHEILKYFIRGTKFYQAYKQKKFIHVK